MLFEKAAVFFFEGFVTVVLALVGDVFDDVRDSRGTYGEGGIAVLPREGSGGELFIVDPRGASAFESLDCFGDGEGFRDFNEEMDMVFDAANAEGMHVVLLSDAGEVCPNF